MFEVIYATVLLLIVIATSSIVTSALGRKLPFEYLPFVFQLTMLILSLTFILTLNVKVVLLKPSPLLVFTLIVIPLSYYANVTALRYNYEPYFMPKKDTLKIPLLLFLAPISEEMCFRGMYESMIKDPLLSVILPSLIFGLLHYAPYSQGPRGLRLVAVSTALTIGFVLSIVYKTNGLIASIFAHALANFTAIVVDRLKGLSP